MSCPWYKVQSRDIYQQFPLLVGLIAKYGWVLYTIALTMRSLLVEYTLEAYLTPPPSLRFFPIGVAINSILKQLLIVY